MDGIRKNVLIGLLIGIVVTVLLWIIVVDVIETSKVNAGYLTYRHKTYKVTLYDTLDVPEKDKD